MKKISLALMCLGFASAAGAAYRCVDEKGVTHIGDTPPAGCNNVVMEEVSRSGMVLRKIDPTPTPEQLKVRIEEQDRKREAEKQAAEQKRKDLALLASFSTEREFDVARDRNIEPLNVRIRGAHDRITEIEKRIGQLNDEMEFYKAGKKKGSSSKSQEPPPVLVIQLERAQSEKALLEKTIVDQEKEIVNVKTKFDEDKKRWMALKSGAVAKPTEYVSPDAKKPSRGNY